MHRGAGGNASGSPSLDPGHFATAAVGAERAWIEMRTPAGLTLRQQKASVPGRFPEGERDRIGFDVERGWIDAGHAVCAAPRITVQ